MYNRMTKEDIKIHAEKAYSLYHELIGAPEDACWIINPRDYHYLKAELDEGKRDASPIPQLLGLDAVVAHVWRKPPIIVMNIQAIDFLEEANDE